MQLGSLQAVQLWVMEAHNILLLLLNFEEYIHTRDSRAKLNQKQLKVTLNHNILRAYNM
jgi:hypothetical protein